MFQFYQLTSNNINGLWYSDGRLEACAGAHKNTCIPRPLLVYSITLHTLDFGQRGEVADPICQSSYSILELAYRLRFLHFFFLCRLTCLSFLLLIPPLFFHFPNLSCSATQCYGYGACSHLSSP